MKIFRNLARAVQYVTLLRGESGRVARDWLKEARLTLEARQVSNTTLKCDLDNSSTLTELNFRPLKLW